MLFTQKVMKALSRLPSMLPTNFPFSRGGAAEPRESPEEAKNMQLSGFE